MEAWKVIRERAEELGIPDAELSRRTGIGGETLHWCLRSLRTLKADELVVICAELGLDLSDFEVD